MSVKSLQGCCTVIARLSEEKAMSLDLAIIANTFEKSQVC